MSCIVNALCSQQPKQPLHPTSMGIRQTLLFCQCSTSSWWLALFPLWAFTFQSFQVTISSNKITCFKASDCGNTLGLSDVGVIVSGNLRFLPKSTSSCQWLSVVTRAVDTLDCWSYFSESTMLPRWTEVLAAVDGWYNVLSLSLSSASGHATSMSANL